MMRIWFSVAVFLIAAGSAPATEIWISANESVNPGSLPPATFAEVPTLVHAPNSSQSLYLWARPDSGKTLENWSLRLHTVPDTALLSFTTSSIESFANPSLGDTGSPDFDDIVRWEYVSEPIGDFSEISDLLAFTINSEERTGVGIGPDSSGDFGSTYDDPLYDSVNNSWLIGKIDFDVGPNKGSTELFLQIGTFGLNNLGETSMVASVVFGASTDAALNGNSERETDSATADAILVVADADFDTDMDVDGDDFLTWQRNFGLTGSATQALGDANGDTDVDATDLVAWEGQFGSTNSSLALNSSVIPEPASWSLTLVALFTYFSLFRNRHAFSSWQFPLTNRRCQFVYLCRRHVDKFDNPPSYSASIR